MTSTTLTDRLTAGTKPKNVPLSIYLDEDLMHFLTVSSAIMMMEEGRRVQEMAKKGKKAKQGKFSESREVVRALGVIQDLADKFQVDSVEEVKRQLEALQEFKKTVLEATGAKSEQEALKAIKSTKK